MEFNTLQPRETAVDACARAIRMAIMRGEVAVGERLPPERRLAESFGVNRVTVRGALGRLASERLLRVRQGSGYVVRDYARDGGPQLIAGLAELAEERGDLSEVVEDVLLVRRHLARAVLERLVDRGRDASAVCAAIDHFEQVVRRGAEIAAIAAADLDIVAALLDATNSAVLGLCMNPVAHVVSALPALREVIYADPESNVVGWRLLSSWLDTRDPARIDDIIAALEARDRTSVARTRRSK